MTHGKPQHFEWYENFYYTQDNPVLYTGGMYQEFNRILLTILANSDEEAAMVSPSSTPLPSVRIECACVLPALVGCVRCPSVVMTLQWGCECGVGGLGSLLS